MSSLNIQSSCASCSDWSTKGGGSDSVGWSACNTKKGSLVPQPQEGTDGYANSLFNLSESLSKGWSKSTGQCGGSYNGYDNDAGDCGKCNSYATSSENFSRGRPAPWARPNSFLNLGTTWSVQKPYNL